MSPKSQIANHKSQIPTGHRYLRLADLRRLRHLSFTTRRLVEGQYAGQHASPQRGQSVEFSDYREYVPGDEVGDIDWKVFGRSDRLFIKLFEHQTDLSVSILIDASASMAYRGADARVVDDPVQTDGQRASWLTSLVLTQQKQRIDRDQAPFVSPSKYDHACLMAAAIAFLVTKQQDKVAFGVAQDGLINYHPPQGSPKHMNNVLGVMEDVVPAGKARLADAINSLGRRISRRGLVIIFSDLLDDQQQVLAALAAITHRGNEIIVFQTLQADELKLPSLNEVVFLDSETQQPLRLNVKDVTPAYEKRLKTFLDGWSAALRARQIDHNLTSTATPYQKALERYLVNRATMMR